MSTFKVFPKNRHQKSQHKRHKRPRITTNSLSLIIHQMNSFGPDHFRRLTECSTTSVQTIDRSRISGQIANVALKTQRIYVKMISREIFLYTMYIKSILVDIDQRNIAGGIASECLRVCECCAEKFLARHCPFGPSPHQACRCKNTMSLNPQHRPNYRNFALFFLLSCG